MAMFSIMVASFSMWSGALDSFDDILFQPIIPLA